MDYNTYQPHTDLETVVKCYWTLQVPADPNTQKQLILPDGCLEMIFMFGDDIRRYTSEETSIIQPRNMLIGQITDQFYIQPTGRVDIFSIRFYPYGFTNFIDEPLGQFANKETPLRDLFGEEVADQIIQKMTAAASTDDRIKIIDEFLIERLNNQAVIDKIVKSTIDAMMLSNGSTSVNDLLKDDIAKRRQLERKFNKLIGISPKQLSKIIRLQATLQRLLHRNEQSLTDIAYERDYYDQAHFIKDFKDFTGIKPSEFLSHENMLLSSVFYKNDKLSQNYNP